MCELWPPINFCPFFFFVTGKQDENESNSSACISQGSYCFSFKFIIPDKYLPTSFEGHHGNIRYWARAVIDRGLGKKRLKTKPAPFLIGDYVALDDFEHVSVRVFDSSKGIFAALIYLLIYLIMLSVSCTSD